MSTDSTETAGPSLQDYAGDAPLQTAKRLFNATRPKFAPASVLPVLAGSAWGFHAAGGFDVLVFVLAMFATVCVHGASNVLNDVGDDSGGTDRQNQDRIYPYTGGSQFIQAGIMNSAEMARWGVSLLALAAIAGFALIVLKGPVVLYFGMAGVALAVLYSLGPARLASLGVGETAVGIGFGIIPVSGAAWLQSGTIDASLVLFSLPVSAWVAAILLINEVPDIAADGATGKRTLPVRFGLGATAGIYVALHLAAVGVVGWLTYTGALPLLAPLVPAALLVLAVRAGAAIRHGVARREPMTRAIESTLAIHTLGSIWLIGCVLFQHWWT